MAPSSHPPATHERVSLRSDTRALSPPFLPPPPPPPTLPLLDSRLLAGAAAGLAFLHENGVVHNDIKADNVLIFGPAPGKRQRTAKMADFGLALGECALETNRFMQGRL